MKKQNIFQILALITIIAIILIVLNSFKKEPEPIYTPLPVSTPLPSPAGGGKG